MSEEKRGPLFRTRMRRNRNKRRKSEYRSNPDEDEELPEMIKTDILLIKEAQALRESNRASGLDISIKGRKTESEKDMERNSERDSEAVIGLQSNFAAETSTHFMQQHMNKYIDDGIRSKFGDKSKGREETKKPVTSDEDNLFTIPDNLRVEDRQLYDPGEGIPAAGVEEVEVPDEVRLKNELETVLAHNRLMDKKSRSSRQNKKTECWELAKAKLVQQGDITAGPDDCTSKISGAFARDSKRVPSLHKTGGKGNPTVSSDSGSALKKPRFATATDALIADRFRKRWRR